MVLTELRGEIKKTFNTPVQYFSHVPESLVLQTVCCDFSLSPYVGKQATQGLHLAWTIYF